MKSTVLNRRQFVAASAAGAFAGTLLRPGRSTARAANSAIRKTDHFWFRLAPEGPYIDSQRDSKAFGFDDAKIYLSEDNAKSWAYSLPFPDAARITFSCLLKNGNVLFATNEKLFLSSDNLRSYREIVVKKPDGSDYRPHTAKNPEQPGWYFHPLDGIHTWDIDGSEMLVWGNYCNVLGGPVPVNIYYSTDGGETVKLAYSFGRNPKFQEKDTPPESYLGDPNNSVIAATFTRWFTTRPSEPSMLVPETSIAATATNAIGCAACTMRGPIAGTGRCWSP